MEEKEEATELEFLRYFFQFADFGPGEGDVRLAIEADFEAKTGTLVPPTTGIHNG